MKTIDDASTGIEGESDAPAIVMVANRRDAATLVLPVPAELGRNVTAGGATHDIEDERMSRDHAIVRREGKTWVIVDRDSRNGTYVDGERITGEIRKPDDVVLRLGHTVFVLLADARGHGEPLRAGRPEGQPAPATAGFLPGLVIGPELARAFAQIERNATGDTLLVHGESGSGKELAARLYHDAGPRKSGPFVAVNCATIPEGVAERLMFGAKKGAFSGAIDALGHFQMANGGTLFLDEIAELDAKVQAKLLRVIETREVVPVGSSSASAINLGIVAASHRELRAAVADRKFRDDLYYRLARATVYLPPLRLRKVDVARLVQREVVGVDAKLAVHAKLIEACCVRPWPGNVRELRAALREAANVALDAGRDVVRIEDLSLTAGMPVSTSQPDTNLERPIGKREKVPELDKATIEAALARANNVISVAARSLGLHRTQLYRLMEKLGLAR